MKFEDYDKGSGELIRRLERESAGFFALVIGGPALLQYFAPTLLSTGEKFIFWAAIGGAFLVFREIRQMRIDALRIERARLQTH